jgi:hypothetical protein
VEVGARSGNLAKWRRKMIAELIAQSYEIWSAKATMALAELSGAPLGETAFSRFGVVCVEGMTYVESTIAMMI